MRDYCQIPYKEEVHTKKSIQFTTQPLAASVPPLDIHPWIRSRVISHGFIQSAILNAFATGHYSGEERLSFIVSLISNWRLVVFFQLLVAQTYVYLCMCVLLCV